MESSAPRLVVNLPRRNGRGIVAQAMAEFQARQQAEAVRLVVEPLPRRVTAQPGKRGATVNFG